MFLASMPYAQERKARFSTLRPDLRATQRSITAIEQRFNEVKAKILLGERPLVPTSKWDSILTGQSVDFDKI